MTLPELPYRPIDPKKYRPNIALIGCGWVTEYHLKAYKSAGYNVVALCDCNAAKAIKRQKQFYPDAKVYPDHREVLKHDDIEVVDIATHPAERVTLIEDALRAGKHVLSQKPFALDLDIGQRLVELADKLGRKLAVNQNGRWAPHFSYLRHLVAGGHLGEMMAAHLAVHWDHNWTAGTPFDRVHHLVLYDFAIHWFDIVTQFFPGASPRRVYATLAAAPNQRARPPLLAQALIEFDGASAGGSGKRGDGSKGGDGSAGSAGSTGAQASLVFDGSTPFGPLDTTYLTGTRGSAFSQGPDLNSQRITFTSAAGVAAPSLQGTWFLDGFHGTMAELLCAIEENRAPSNAAAGNLKSLALCFAALASADSGTPREVGSVRRVGK